MLYHIEVRKSDEILFVEMRRHKLNSNSRLAYKKAIKIEDQA